MVWSPVWLNVLQTIVWLPFKSHAQSSFDKSVLLSNPHSKMVGFCFGLAMPTLVWYTTLHSAILDTEGLCFYPFAFRQRLKCALTLAWPSSPTLSTPPCPSPAKCSRRRASSTRTRFSASPPSTLSEPTSSSQS